MEMPKSGILQEQEIRPGCGGVGRAWTGPITEKKNYSREMSPANHLRVDIIKHRGNW